MKNQNKLDKSTGPTAVPVQRGSVSQNEASGSYTTVIGYGAREPPQHADTERGVNCLANKTCSKWILWCRRFLFHRNQCFASSATTSAFASSVFVGCAILCWARRDKLMQSYLHQRYKGPALDGVPKLSMSKLGTIYPRPGRSPDFRSLNPSMKRSFSSNTILLNDEDEHPADLPNGPWNPFNTRSETWNTGSLLAVARERHAAVDRLKRAESPPMRYELRRPVSAQRLHTHRTASLAAQQWPRHALPTDAKHMSSSVELLTPRPFSVGGGNWSPSKPVKAVGSTKDFNAPAGNLYARRLSPATYGWAGAGGFGARKGMVFR